MGERTLSYSKCPECGGVTEAYDAPSSLLYSELCDNCGWKSPLKYFEIDENEIMLGIEEEFTKRKEEV